MSIVILLTELTSLESLPTKILIVWLLGLISLYIYRLYFSPISHFPGPKLAAISRWYEAYYEIILDGQYSRKIAELHDQYDSAIHKRRRAALAPMFSKRYILGIEPLIREHVELLCTRIDGLRISKTPINVTKAYPAMTGDVIMEYAFAFSYKQVQSPNFDSFHEAYVTTSFLGHYTGQFPWLKPIMMGIPDSVAARLQPGLKSVLQLKRVTSPLTNFLAFNSLTLGRINSETDTSKDSRHTIFDEILQSKLPPEDKSQERLADEANIVVGAGLETTSYALCVGTFHIVNTPRISSRLHAELVQAFPNKDITPKLSILEKLPYLKACIQESLRLSYGLSSRNPRMSHQEFQYKDWIVPKGTVVAMTIPDVHHDERIFPDSHSFIPERWLDNPRTAEGVALDHYLVTFGRGQRSCLGINMAWAEMQMVLGSMFRRYRFELFETDVSDVKMAHDYFIPAVKWDSKGVRIMAFEVGN
ncbi:cytochrome P450 [Halenospora varia]|nr:cytochrome P450 [Halenospora varia]